MIELKDFYIPISDDKRLELAIVEIFEKELFEPLLASLEMKNNFLTHNSIDDIREALINEKIFYNKILNIFYSKKPYGTKLFSALQKLGGKLNRRTGNFEVSYFDLPIFLRTTIDKIDLNAILQKENLQKALSVISKISTEEQDLSIYFKDTGNKFNKSFEDSYKKKIGQIPIINKKISLKMRDKISKTYSDNLNKYIAGFKEEEVRKIRSLVERQALAGNRSSALKETLIKEYGVSQNKAKFLARQEMSLFMASLQQAEFQEYGAKKIKWHTSQDERVRDEHKLLNGKVFSFDNLPIIDIRTGERGLPGQAFGCRCTMSAVFDLN